MAELSNSDRKRLLKNKHVLKVTGETIVYTPEFKIHAVKENLKGRSPSEIFREAGIEITFFDLTYPKDTVKRWRKVYKSRGEQGLRENLQGKKSTGRPKKKFDPNDIDSLKERVAYLEAENEFLKKIRALEEQYVKKNGLK
jgi:transposase-like protein